MCCHTITAIESINQTYSYQLFGSIVIEPITKSCSQKVNRTETDRLKSKPVFNLKPFLGFSSRWSRNIVEDFKNMGKTDHDQHEIDENHYLSVIFSKNNEWKKAY